MIAIKHPFVSNIADDPQAAADGQVLPSHWNQNHALLVNAKSLVGNSTQTNGTSEEIAVLGNAVLSNSGLLVGALSLTSTAPLNAYKLITTDATGLAIYASSADVTHVDQVLGVALNSGTTLQVQTMGLVDNTGWSWTAGQPLFVGVNGDITTNPNTGLFSQLVGYAQSATRIFIRLGRATVRA